MKPSNLLYEKNDLFPGFFHSEGANLKQGLTLNDKSERRENLLSTFPHNGKVFCFV